LTSLSVFLFHSIFRIANCVGFNNYRHFYFFLFFLAAGSLYYLFITVPLILAPDFNSDRSPSSKAVFLTFVLSSAAFLFVGGFWCFHTYLLFTNQTTIEYYTNCRNERKAVKKGKQWYNPYDLGWKENFRQTFGCSIFSFRWLMPGIKPLGDGLRYPVVQQINNVELKQFYSTSDEGRARQSEQDKADESLDQLESGQSERSALIDREEDTGSEGAIKDRSQ
jgi:hypothetical protein